MRIETLALKFPGWPRRSRDLAGAVDAQGVVQPPYAPAISRWQRAAMWFGVAAVLVTLLVYGFYYAVMVPYQLKLFLAPFVPLAAFAVWALPESRAQPTKALERLFWGFYLGTMLWPNYLAIALPGMPWISVVRLFGLPLAIVLLVRISTSKPFVEEISATIKTIPGLGFFMAAFTVIQICTIPVSEDPLTSAQQTFDNQIGWTAIFFASLYIFRRTGSAERWAAYFCISAVAICVECLWEIKVEHPPWAGHLPSFFPINDESVQHTLAGSRRLGVGEYRIEGNQSTSLGLAEFMALATPFLLHFMMGKYRFWTRLLAGLSLPFVFFIILSTHARLGMVGFFLSCLLYLSVWSYQQWRSSKSNILGPAIVAAYPFFFVAFVTASFYVQRLKNIVWGNSETQASNEGRVEQMNKGIPLVLRHPWGYGTGRGAETLGFTDGAGTLTIDNYYLNVALDWGILGFIVYYGMIIMVAWGAGKNGWVHPLKRREYTFLIPAGIALIEFFVIKSIFSQTYNHKLQFMMFGMIAALIYRIRNGDDGEVSVAPAPPAPEARPRRRLFGGAPSPVAQVDARR